MADLLRTELLATYGGLWIDATVFLTAKIPNYIFEKDIFLYKYFSQDNCRAIYNNFFIYSKKNNPFLKTIRHVLYAYWKKESKAREYFIWQLMAGIILEKKPYYDKDIYAVPVALAEMLGENWMKPYNENWWRILTSTSSIHKLSWKITNQDSVQGSYYDKILHGEL